jgi:trehalose 6-phosphate phosphatase
MTPDGSPSRPSPTGWVELAQTPRALFLDIDGTLLEFETHPDLVRATQGLIRLLQGVSDAMGGALALISGRSIADIDRIFAPWRPHAAGIHGAEVRGPEATRTHSTEPSQLAELRRACSTAAENLPGVWVEDKGMSIALHYRHNPTAGRELGLLAAELAARSAGTFEVQPGVFVYELRPAAYDKGLAVVELMAEAPFAGRSPVVVGDDRTDEFAFAAALDMGGTAVIVGDRSDTCAPLRLTGPAEVRSWLTELIEEVRP